MFLLTSIVFFWVVCLCILWLWKKELFLSAWNEPYFLDTPLLIESDDWGPGGEFHAQRLNLLFNTLQKHKDELNRSAVLTANIVLSVPDLLSINNTGEYHRIFLNDHSPLIFNVMQEGIHSGILVPQLHGLEHINGSSFTKLWLQNNPRLPRSEMHNKWWDWESLDSPLQGHYVDGSCLPTTPIDELEAEAIIKMATDSFTNLFGHSSTTTVAPCYLWDDSIERIWKNNKIRSIQTAGYRCTGRNKSGNYIQNPSVIRIGNKNKYSQTYLIRNVMFEPVDGTHTAETAFIQAKAAFKQGLPISISTHRYNFTRSEKECIDSLIGLDNLLTKICSHLPNIRFTASPELSDFLHGDSISLTNNFNNNQWPTFKTVNNIFHKIPYFLYRLYYRHPKLNLFCYLTGLAIPISIIMFIRYINIVQYKYHHF